jgi:hypothetical protein
MIVYIIMSIITENVNDVVVAFNMNNFFYKSADANDLDNCELQTELIARCDKININKNNIHRCYQKELCDNRKNALMLQKSQMLYSGADGRYLDTRKLYFSSLQNTLNLGIGIIGLIFIICNKK